MYTVFTYIVASLISSCYNNTFFLLVGNLRQCFIPDTGFKSPPFGLESFEISSYCTYKREILNLSTKTHSNLGGLHASSKHC